MQNIYIGNSHIGDELAIAQQLISDILTFLRLMYWILRLWPQKCPIWAPHRGALSGAPVAISQASLLGKKAKVLKAVNDQSFHFDHLLLVKSIF